MKQSSVANISENEYSELLKTAVTQIESGRNSIALQINTAANSTYWNLGKLLHDRQIEGGYGSNVINRLSVDLKSVFPDMGLSPRNLWNMKLFYERYADSDKKLLQAVAVLQWGHNLLLINKKLSDDETYYYALECVSKGWNRDMLLNAIKMDSTKDFNRQVKNNIEKFDADFMFQLTKNEQDEILRSKFLTLEQGKFSKYLPYAFTEQGIYMLMTVKH